MEVVDHDEIIEINQETSSETNPPRQLCARPVQRALVVRLNRRPSLEEQRLVPMSAPFRGFSAFVRFQCRAKIHHIQHVVLPDPSLTTAISSRVEE